MSTVPTAVLREAYVALLIAEREAADAPPGSTAALRWHEAMRTRVNYQVYVMNEIDNTEAPCVALIAT